MINIYPDKTLLTKTNDIPIKDIHSDTFTQIGSSMLEIMRKKGGIGLSANQIGLHINMCVVEINNKNPLMMLNPRIIKTSKNRVTSSEGCLSLPFVSLDVSRVDKITIEYEDVTGETQTLDADGILSRCLQHEIDHLHGFTLMNRVSEYHKSKARRELDKWKKYQKRKS